MKTLIFSTMLFVASFSAVAAHSDCAAFPAEKVYGVKISPFCMAIVKGDLEAVEKFLEMGADVNEKSNGLSPLMYAAKYNRIAIMEVLLAKGADIKAKDTKNGFTAVKFAQLSNATEALEVLERALTL